MTHKRITQFNQQRKCEASQESGILQRAAVRSVSDAGVQSTDARQAQPLGNSALSKDFSRVPISTTKPQPIIGSVVQQYNGNNTIQRAAPTGQLVQRTNSESENPSETARIREFQASIRGSSLIPGKNNLKERFPDGPLFSDDELERIKSMSNKASTIKWLQDAGIGEYREAEDYLEKKNSQIG